MNPPPDLRRRIPQVAKLLERDAVRAAIDARGRGVVDRVAAQLVGDLRELARSDDEAAFETALETIDRRIATAADQAALHSLRRVINATGVVVHTNLGRSPLSPEVAAHVAAIAASYSNLEFDLETGERGQRETHAERRLQTMLRAEASVVVNNNAAAVLLAVNTFAFGREVLVSRGELVEIGGSFRIPEILSKGGARLVEVGTTNRTRIADFEKAVTPATGLILRVHPSNFRITGFTEEATIDELVALGRERSLAVVEDLGSGLLAPMTEPLHEEATVAASLAKGVDVVTASGDKLLGGPQAGLLIGRKKAVDALRKNPLYRALRVDKMTIAALDAVLALHEAGRRESLPVPRMLVASASEVRARVEASRSRLADKRLDAAIEAQDTASAVGGGAAPDVSLPSCALSIKARNISAAVLLLRLRQSAPAIVGRIEQDQVLLDFRTVLPGEEAAIERVLTEILESPIPA